MDEYIQQLVIVNPSLIEVEDTVIFSLAPVSLQLGRRNGRRQEVLLTH